MRIREPRQASADEVKISRDGEYALIEFADPTISATHLKIGPRVRYMADQEILAMYNDMIAARDQLAAAYESVVVKVPPGRPQIEYSERSSHWVPRGDLVRCVIEDGGPDNEVSIHIDDHELPLREADVLRALSLRLDPLGDRLRL